MYPKECFNKSDNEINSDPVFPLPKISLLTRLFIVNSIARLFENSIIESNDSFDNQKQI